MNKIWKPEGVFKDRIVIAGTAMVLAALGITGWLLFGGTGSIKDETSVPSTWAKLICFLLVALVLLQGLAYLGVLRFRTLCKASMEARNRLLICRCPYCRRKVGFPAGKAGSGGLCPRCKTAFVLETLE